MNSIIDNNKPDSGQKQRKRKRIRVWPKHDHNSSQNIMHMRTDSNKHDSGQKQRKRKRIRVWPKHDQHSSQNDRTGWPRNDLQEGWLEFISRYDFDLFVTLTFRDDIEPWKAEKRFEKWLGSLNCKLFGWRYKLKGLGIRYVVAYEYQKREILHIHALLGATGLSGLDRAYMAKLWESNGQRNEESGILIDRIVNGHAVIEPYDPTRGAKHYITKYIPKGGELEIFVPRKELERGKCL